MPIAFHPAVALPALRPIARLGARTSGAVACLCLAACAVRSPVRAPAEEPYLRGAVESITHRATASGITVRPGSGQECGIVATVDARTRYLARTGTGGVREAGVGELEVGDTVEVYVQGPVTRSCPAQGYAATMVLAPGATTPER